MSLADSIRRRTDEWEEKKKQEGRDELAREFIAARREGRLDELLDSYNRQADGHHNGQEPESRA